MSEEKITKSAKSKTRTKKQPYVRPPEMPAVKLKTGSAKARRTAARLAAVQVLYQLIISGHTDAEKEVDEFIKTRVGFDIDGDVLVPADTDMLRAIVLGVDDRRGDIAEIVDANIPEGKRETLDTLLKCTLYAGTWELMQSETDTGIIMADYINVTHGFYDAGEAKLINALLDKIAKALRA